MKPEKVLEYGVRALSRQIVYLTLNRESVSLREHGNSSGTLKYPNDFDYVKKKICSITKSEEMEELVEPHGKSKKKQKHH
jgi:hypothetical protein